MVAASVKKVNYLNNKDILREIHKSKSSYCTFLRPELAQYDLIVSSIPEMLLRVDEARIARADRLTKAAVDMQAGIGNKVRANSVAIDPTTIKTEEIVFRVMTWEHIPLAPNGGKKPKKSKNTSDIGDLSELLLADVVEDEYSISDSDSDIDSTAEIDLLEPIYPLKIHNKRLYVKVNFLPFKHYQIDTNGTPLCVGKSHWKGDLITGSFCRDHGQTTKTLALMFMKLCDRYATKYNWRGYCVDTNTEALTQRGWLDIDQINEDDIILSYSAGELKWSKIKSIYRGDFDGFMHKLTTRTVDALVTPGHKFVTDRGLIKAEYLLESDKVIWTGTAINNDYQIYSDDLVELLGLIFIYGEYHYDDAEKIKTIDIILDNSSSVTKTRQCLTILKFNFSEKVDSNNNICFSLDEPHSNKIYNIIPTKNLTMEFITSLTKIQRELLINCIVKNSEWRSNENTQSLHYTQKNKEQIELFRILCTISGYRSHIQHCCEQVSFGKLIQYFTINIFSERFNQINGECINFHGGKRNGPGGLHKTEKVDYPNEPTTYFKGRVWCPETEYGCFMARRNNTVYLTGNTYVDEMKGHSMLQLAQVGLQFDESKSDNPFSYFTQVLLHTFTRVFNIEKRNQNLRDDILQQNNLNPSYTRMNSNTNDLGYGADE